MRKTLFMAILLVGLAVLVFACQNVSAPGAGSKATASKSCDETLASIGDSKICMSDFNSRLEKIPPFYRKRTATKKGKMEFLNRMVEDELFFQEAMRRNLNQDPEVVDQLEQIRKSILSGKVKKELMETTVEISDADVKKYFDANTEEFMSPETVTVRHILFRVKHKATDGESADKNKKAEQVLAEIKAGKIGFEDAAKKYSEDKTSAKKGGELAPVRKGIKSAEFEKAAFAMSKAGEISDVFKDRRGFNIIQFVSKTDPELKEFDKVEARIKRKLQQEGRKTEMETFTEQLRQKSQVDINEDLLIDEDGADAAAPAAPELPLIGEKKKAKKAEGK
jgi:peptidyl-prolyl cis-trans isomerase C